MWSQHAANTGLRPPSVPWTRPLVVWAYLLVFRRPKGAGATDESSVEVDRTPSEVTVDGGYLMRLLMPLPGPDGKCEIR